MKACPNCYLSFNDGYICPHCGGQLVDYNPEQQAQTNPYQGQSQQSNYYNQQTQAMQSAPTQTNYPQQQYQRPPVNNFPPTIIKKRTGLVVFLTLLLLALAAFTAYLVYNEYEERTKPTELDTKIVESTWAWYSSLNNVVTAIEAQNPTTNQSAGGIPERGASSQQVAGNEAGENTDSSAAATSDATTSSPTSESASPEGEASANNSAGNTGNTGENVSTTSATSDEASTGSSLSESIQALNGSIDQSTADIAIFLVLSDSEYIKPIDEPMQALKEKYPDLVSSWDGIKGSLSANKETASQIVYMARTFRQAGESFKRTAEKEGFNTSSWN